MTPTLTLTLTPDECLAVLIAIEIEIDDLERYLRTKDMSKLAWKATVKRLAELKMVKDRMTQKPESV
jgi:hypothetical protein